MKNIALYIGFFLLFAPQITSAQEIQCAENGYTVVFVNGIFSTKLKAEQERKALQEKLGNSFGSEPLTVQLGYNPTHLAGAGDLMQSVAQQFSYSVSDYDLHTILMQIHPEVTTRKLLIVGHSQGTYYADEMHGYLLTHGAPANAINVYEVASPAPKLVAGGKYLNSSGDLLLNYLRDTLHFKTLPANVDISPQAGDASPVWSGHSFLNAYLAGASDRIVSDISEQLAALTADGATAGDCFTPPEATIGYKTQRAIFAVADPSAVALRVGSEVTLRGAYAVGKSVLFLAQGAVEFLTDTIVVAASPRDEKTDTKKTFDVIKSLYGSSLTEEEYKELNDSQGGAVAFALPPKEKPIPVNGGFVEGTSTGPVSVPTTPTSTEPFIPAPSTPTQGGGSSSAPVEVSEPVTVITPEPTPEPEPTPQPPVPPQLVINEVQWGGDRVDSAREWVEIKNLSDAEVNLSDIVLTATEGGAQYIPLSGSIPANGFFIVEQVSGAPVDPGFAEVFEFESLSDSGVQLALVQVGDWGTTTIDQTPTIATCNGWCAGANLQTTPFSNTLSMERVDASASGLVASNWASNDTYTVSANMPGGPGGQALYATVAAENSKHLPPAGFFCSGDASILVPSNTAVAYTPASSNCTYLSAFMDFITGSHNATAVLYQGVVGSSTAVSTVSYMANAHTANTTIDFSTLTTGEYFIALFHTNGNAGPSFNVFYTGDMFSYLQTGIQTNGIPGAPPLDFKIIPFILAP